MKTDIKITEVLSRVITIDSSSTEEAINIVEDMYRNEEIVLDYSDFNDDVIIERNEKIFNSKKDFLINKVNDYLIKDEKRHYEESEDSNEHIYLTLLELQNYI